MIRHMKVAGLMCLGTLVGVLAWQGQGAQYDDLEPKSLSRFDGPAAVAPPASSIALTPRFEATVDAPPVAVHEPVKVVRRSSTYFNAALNVAAQVALQNKDGVLALEVAQRFERCMLIAESRALQVRSGMAQSPNHDPQQVAQCQTLPPQAGAVHRALVELAFAQGIPSAAIAMYHLNPSPEVATVVKQMAFEGKDFLAMQAMILSFSPLDRFSMSENDFDLLRRSAYELSRINPGMLSPDSLAELESMYAGISHQTWRKGRADVQRFGDVQMTPQDLERARAIAKKLSESVKTGKYAQ